MSSPMRPDRVGRVAPLPRTAWATALVALIDVVVIFFACGLRAACFGAGAVAMGWATGVLHERYAGQ